ncbi:MAG: transcriptional regulator PpsR [Pseudomonadota bacterium]
MDMLAPRETVIPFSEPRKALGGLSVTAVERLVLTSSDVALAIDGAGVILDVAFGGSELAEDDCGVRRGRLWRDTVTEEGRAKIDELLATAAAGEAPRWRQVTHRTADGSQAPVVYSAVRLERGEEQGASEAAGPAVIAVGRDLRSVATLQRRLIDAQQAMEREYARLRHAETRYRLLFQSTAESVLIVDAETRRIVEANPAALALIGLTAKAAARTTLPDLFDKDGADVLESLLASVRSTGRTDGARARFAGGGAERLITASLFRQEAATLFLVRLGADAVPGGEEAQAALANLSKIAESAPDALAITDLSGAVLFANAAFLDLAQIAAEAQAIGEPIERWLGRPGIDFDVLAGNLRAHGSVRSYDTIVRDGFGGSEEVEVSAVAVLDGSPPCFGFVMRMSGKKSWAESRAGDKLPRSVEQLTQLIGRVPLRDIVRETTDVIERLCIEAALELTGDNRASAAELLGLSRQSLYVKLRRYGLGDLDAEPDE